MTNKEIIMKLIGPIKPIGKTEVDNERFSNLIDLCELTDELVTLIDDIAFDYKNRQESTIERASDYAKDFLTNTLGIKE